MIDELRGFRKPKFLEERKLKGPLEVRLVLCLLGLTLALAGCSERRTYRSLDAVFIVSNEVYCVVRDDRMRVRKQYGIEGVRERSELLDQTVNLWRVGLSPSGGIPNVAKRKIGRISTGEESSFEPVLGTPLFIRRWQERGPSLVRHAAVWNSASRRELAIDFSSAIAFDRTRQRAVMPWRGGVSVVTLASLTSETPQAVHKPHWSDALNFPEYAYRHALLSRDGGQLIFLPEGSSPRCCHVLELGDDRPQKINLPSNLMWNDVLDAEVIDGELYFVTRNLGSQNDSHQITDATWTALASLPGDRQWFLPTWDIEGSRLVFPEFSAFSQNINAPIRFRVWDYRGNSDSIVAVRKGWKSA